MLRKSAQSLYIPLTETNGDEENKPLEESFAPPLEHKPSLLSPSRLLFVASSLIFLILLMVDTPVLRVPEWPGRCAKAVKGKPLVQYALMVDAGSTGSRLHVYRFNFCESSVSPILEDELFVEVKPGLSFYKDDTSRAGMSLQSLMELSMANVSSSMRKCSPVAVKATAGLRVLNEIQVNGILSSVEQTVKSYPFPVHDDKGIAIMDGSDEGVFAWLTVNYLTKRLKSSTQKTVAIMDLGGASTQIVFEPVDPKQIESFNEYGASMKFGDRSFELYQHSYLGYGLNHGRDKVFQNAANLKLTAEFPCLLPQTAFKGENLTFIGRSSNATFDECASFIGKQVFKKDKCAFKSCSFDGVHMPAVPTAFPDTDGRALYAFSYFYDRTYPLGLRDKFKIKEIQTLGQKVCSNTPGSFPAETSALLKENPLWCLELAYMYTLLTTGYGMNEQRELVVMKKIDGVETGWALGAALTMVDQFLAKGQCLYS